MKLIKSFSVLAIITIITQLLMMIRNMLMANHFGVSAEMDSYNLANVLTVSTMGIVSAAVTTILIPLLSNLDESKEKRESINTFITVLGLFSVSLILLFFIFGYPVISLFTSGNASEIQMLTFQLTLILAVSQLFKVYTGISTAFLQTNEDFINPKMATLLAGMVSVSYFAFSTNPNIYAITIVLGVSFVVEAIYIAIKQRKIAFELKLCLKFSNPTFKLLMKNTLPIIVSSAAFQASLVFSNFIASYFGTGYVSIFGYGNQIVNIFHSLIILNIIMLLYPNLARKFDENIDNAKESLVTYMNLTNLLVIPIVFGFIAVGDIIIEILFERGNFSAENTQQVYLMSAILFLSFPINTVRDYIYRSFYCLNDTRTPSRNSLLVVVINIILIVVLIPFAKVYAIAIGPVLSSVISLLLSYNKLKKKIGPLDSSKQMLKTHCILALSGLLMCLLTIEAKQVLVSIKLNPIIELFILIIVGGVIFISICYFTQRKLVSDVLKIRKGS
ncbi:teichoic acid transporter [Bacillus mycoides]|uniref:murein biosynthesis integral membrane protein MurJ n=1 Tax=Bacillus mycoides TaxID=1405 RepID=UPI001C027833|nr:lipid II flippase MurJ [Bacillus mycoides]QWH63544.1 teichoic acid transporter [Bacillus mycoides]